MRGVVCCSEQRTGAARMQARRVNTASCWLRRALTAAAGCSRCRRTPAPELPHGDRTVRPIETLGLPSYLPDTPTPSIISGYLKVSRIYCSVIRSRSRCGRTTPATRLNVRADWVAKQACVAALCAHSRAGRCRAPAAHRKPRRSDAQT
ncbi:unnamed protein product [Arctia plantaginis]|uniref:Uncharacterized protein n=1 Tax=Arctia plantaginis TaxID=874455 RepID=A0A8S0YRV7_ARCPL|nr:unnamed protein product [Arctia plantaginis]